MFMTTRAVPPVWVKETSVLETLLLMTRRHALFSPLMSLCRRISSFGSDLRSLLLVAMRIVTRLLLLDVSVISVLCCRSRLFLGLFDSVMMMCLWALYPVPTRRLPWHLRNVLLMPFVS